MPLTSPPRLRTAVQQARIEAAERTGVVVDLRDAEIARLELLDEALAPLFAELPAEIELFDHGVTTGETPRLWIDVVAHIAMARDKRTYRLLQDTRLGRKILSESPAIPDMVEAVTRYVAQRLVERERALAAYRIDASSRRVTPPRRAGRALLLVGTGMLLGALAVIGLAVVLALWLPGR